MSLTGRRSEAKKPHGTGGTVRFRPAVNHPVAAGASDADIALGQGEFSEPRVGVRLAGGRPGEDASASERPQPAAPARPKAAPLKS